MSLRINTNISAINAQRNLSMTQARVDNSLAKLSSGLRINRASDDAAGLGIANRLRADVRALTQASKNAEQAASLLQIAEGATSSIQDILERMKELATQAASDNTDGAGRSRLNEEFTKLHAEIGRLVDTTKFQGRTLLDNSFGNTIDLDDTVSTVLAATSVVHSASIAGAAAGTYTLSNAAAGELTLTIGANTQTVTLTADGAQTVQFSELGVTLELNNRYDNSVNTNVVGDLVVVQGANGGSFMVGSSGDYTGQDLINLDSLNLKTDSTALNLDGLNMSTAAAARSLLASIDTAMGVVSSALGKIGAAQNRIEYASQNLRVTIQNVAAAESTIRDLDMAEEMTVFTKNQLLAQAGTAMLAQANQSAAGILQLLRG